MKRICLWLLCLGILSPCSSWAAEPKHDDDEAAIRKTSAAYLEAFNKHDAKALADFWSPDAVYLNQTTGEEVVGRDEIAKQFVEMFKNEPDLKMTAVTDSVGFISPNVAEEHGKSTITAPKQEPEEVPYLAVYVRRDGKWLLDRVTDEAKEAGDSHFEQLKQLEWMIGHWVDKDKEDGVDIETDCNWTKNRAFITRSFTVSTATEIESVRNANHWLGCGRQGHSLVDFRFRRRLCGSDLDVQEGPLVRRQQRRIGRRAKGLDDQRHQTDRRQLIHVANDRAHGRRRTAAEHSRSVDRARAIGGVLVNVCHWQTQSASGSRTGTGRLRRPVLLVRKRIIRHTSRIRAIP